MCLGDPDIEHLERQSRLDQRAAQRATSQLPGIANVVAPLTHLFGKFARQGHLGMASMEDVGGETEFTNRMVEIGISAIPNTMINTSG